MIEIPKGLYQELGRRLLTELGTAQTFWQDTLYIKGTDAETTLHCTLMVYRDENQNLEDIVPVWWEFHHTVNGKERLTDFTFTHLKSYLL